MATHKAAVIPINLKAAVKANLDRDVLLCILEMVDLNSQVKWLLLHAVPAGSWIAEACSWSSCPIHWHKWPKGEWGWPEELLLVKCM